MFMCVSFLIFLSNVSAAGKDYGHGKSLSPLMWTWGSRSAKWNAFGKFCEDDAIGNNLGYLGAHGNVTHCSTVERLYVWEKKLYREVKVLQFLLCKDWSFCLNYFLFV